MNRVITACFAFSAALILSAAGCGKPPALDPAIVAQHRTELTLAEEPDGAQTVLDVHRTMMGEEAGEHADHEHAEDDQEHAEGDHEHTDDELANAGEGAATDADAEDHEHEDGEEHADEHADHEHAEHDQEHAEQEHAEHDHDHGNPVISEMDVVLVGSVGGAANPSEQSYPEFPFVEREAVFFLADPEAVAEMEEHAHKHAPGEECAFCAAHAGETVHALAIVQFKGKNGKPLAVGVQDLFDLKEKETVVVEGKAKMLPSGMLTVDATGLYVRR